MPKQSPDPYSLFTKQFPNIEHVLVRIARRQHLSAEERGEFRSFVYRRLLADDCSCLHRFQGKSRWKTFLTVVIQRLFMDFRNHRWGRWRPSARARRRGVGGILLERLVSRDGFGVEEAISILRENHGVRIPSHELRHWAAQLPQRGRPAWVNDSCLQNYCAPERTDAELLDHERGEQACTIYRRLERVLSSLPAQDRLVLKMRYEDDLRINEIARLLARPQKALYREIKAIQAQMKRSLGEMGCHPKEVAEVLAGR